MRLNLPTTKSAGMWARPYAPYACPFAVEDIDKIMPDPTRGVQPCCWITRRRGSLACAPAGDNAPLTAPEPLGLQPLSRSVPGAAVRLTQHIETY
jgi:hypothetical protein